MRDKNDIKSAGRIAIRAKVLVREIMRFIDPPKKNIIKRIGFFQGGWLVNRSKFPLAK
jgi:hypothetical protein